MSELLTFKFDVDGSDFTSAGQASVQVKKKIKANRNFARNYKTGIHSNV